MSIKEKLFGRIDAENVEAAIRRLAIAWYVVAALQGALQILVSLISGALSADLLDALVCAIGGYFLGARKSRAVAVSLFLYALGAGAFTVAALAGAVEGGANVLLALFVIAIGWRGVRATWMYHRSNGLRTAWKRVIAISGLTVAISVLMLAGVGLLEVLEDEMLAGTLALGAVLVPILVVMWPLTRYYPFAYSDMFGDRRPADISAVFD